MKTKDIDKVFLRMFPFTLMLAQKGTQCFFLFNRQKNPDKLFLYQLLIKVRPLISHHENSEYCIAHYNQLRCKYRLKMCLIQGRHCIFMASLFTQFALTPLVLFFSLLSLVPLE